MSTRRFSNKDTSVSEARRFTRQTLSGISREQLEIVELLVSELATNCIRHAQTDFQVTIHGTPAEIRVEVTDHAAGEPILRSPGPADPTGRGLRIVQMLAHTWGVEHKEDVGKTVWFTLSAQVQLADTALQSIPSSQAPALPSKPRKITPLSRQKELDQQGTSEVDGSAYGSHIRRQAGPRFECLLGRCASSRRRCRRSPASRTPCAQFRSAAPRNHSIAACHTNLAGSHAPRHRR